MSRVVLYVWDGRRCTNVQAGARNALRLVGIDLGQDLGSLWGDRVTGAASARLLLLFADRLLRHHEPDEALLLSKGVGEGEG